MTPSACSTSEAPDFDDSARLPCLATGTPAAATTIEAAVEMLSVSAPSPPVPTMSMASSGASTGTIFSRRIETAAAISPTRLALDAHAHEEGADLARRRLAVHDDVHDRAHFLAGQVLPRGDLAEGALDVHQAAFLQVEVAASRLRKFWSSAWPFSEAMLSGWNCTPCTGKRLVLHAHDQAVVGRGGDLERRRAGSPA